MSTCYINSPLEFIFFSLILDCTFQRASSWETGSLFEATAGQYYIPVVWSGFKSLLSRVLSPVEGWGQGYWVSGVGAGEQQSGRPRGCGSTGFSLGCLHECVWGWACPRDIPELFWEAANLAGSWFSRSSRYVGISDETICLRRRRAKSSQPRGMCHFEHSCGKCITHSLFHRPSPVKGKPLPTRISKWVQSLQAKLSFLQTHLNNRAADRWGN